MGVLSKGKNLVFWASTALGGGAIYAVETMILDLSGYLCFSGLVAWAVIAARQLR